MSTKTRIVESEFMQAARTFDEELGNYQRAVEATLRGPLNSAKNLERAAQSLGQVAESEQRLSAASQGLSTALAHSQAPQLAQAEQLLERAKTISARTSEFRLLMEGYRALGTAASSLNAEVLELSRKKKDLGSMGPGASLGSEIHSLQSKMNQVAETALELMAAARKADFEDIARQVDSIRQQILSANNKLTLVSRSLTN